MKKCMIFFVLVAMFASCTAAFASGGNPPGLMFSTVLNGIKLDHKNGNFYLDRIQAVFLPEPSAKSNTIYAYNPDDGGKLGAVLKKADGGEVARYEFYAQQMKAPFWLLNSCKVTETASGNRPSSGRIQLAKGEYVLDFHVEGTHFYHFPFRVDTLESSDPFNPGEKYFLEGDWSDWGYLYYRDANPGMSIQWKVWLRNKGLESHKDVKVELEVKRGGKLVCTTRPHTTYSLRPEWVRYEFDLIFPMEGTSGGAYFKAKDLLSADGSYTLGMKIDGQPYGVWNFKIAGGKLQPEGRAVRGKADPKTFVEGGVDAFWYGK